MAPRATVKTARKPRAKAGVSGSGSGMVTLAQRVQQANRFRDHLNPTAYLSLVRARSLIESYARGDVADLMWTFGAPFTGIECADPDYLALIERRISAVMEMDWDIKTVDPKRADFDANLAQEQAAALRETFDGIENLYEAQEHLVMASFRGFSHLERVMNADGDIVSLLPVDQWNVVRDGAKGQWRYNPEARQTSYQSLGEGMDMPPQQFIVREVKRPIGRFALVKYIRANLSEKDWDGFIEVYGIPGGIVIGPPNVPQGKESEYESAAREAAQGASGYLPHGSTYTANDSPRGSSPFQQRLEWLSQKLILAGTGGMLTMLNGATGIGQGATGAHEETFRQLARAEGRDITGLLHRGVARGVLQAKFPGQPELAYFEVAFRESVTGADVIKDVTALSQAGYQVEVAEVAERTGYRVSLKPAAALPVQPPMFNRQADRDPLLQAMDGDLAPLRNAIAAVLQGGLDAAQVKALRDALPALLKKMNGKPKSAKAWETALREAITAGMTAAPENVT